MKVTQLRLRRITRSLIASLVLGFATQTSLAQETGVLREVWTNISGNGIEQLVNSPNYPNSPTIKDILPELSIPANFSSNYGTRLQAYITPSATGQYSFWIQGDDNCALYLATDSNPQNARLIASVPGSTSTTDWEKYPEQHSANITLTAGQRYYIEALQKEGGGSDFLTVNWDKAGDFARSAIPTALLTPFNSAPAYDPTKTLYVEAGAPKKNYLPADQFQLSGGVFSKSQSLETLAISWTQISGEQATLTDANSLTPTIVASTPGERAFRLTVSDTTETLSDDITVSVFSPLASGTGKFIQEIWLGVDGNNIETLLNHKDYPTRPHLLRTVENLVGPRNWGDRYGSRTRGLITPPETGYYTFYVAGDDDTALFLSNTASPSNAELIAFTPESTKENNWTQFPEQASEPTLLEKGKSYYLELLFVAQWGNDFHAAAWSFNGGSIETIGGEFFIAQTPSNNSAPDFDSAERFVVEAGQNRTIHSPESSVQLKGKTLKFRDSFTVESIAWSQLSGPATANIVSASELSTTVEIPSEGTYIFSLSVTADGIESSDTISITRSSALTSSTGGFTREVWLNLNGGSVNDLLSSPDFPNNPNIVDQLPSLAGPINWDSRYGSRSTGYLVPSRTGLHTFYISADDSAILSLSTDSSPNNIQQIASSGTRSIGDYRDESQISAPISLVAGKRYFIEVLHKQNYGNDHFQVSWSFGDEHNPNPIGGGNLEPSNPDALPIDTSLPEYAFAGPDRHYYAPTKSFDLIGQILNVSETDKFHKATWSYLGNQSGVSIENPSDLSTSVTVPGEDTYTFRLTLQTSGKTHYDDVSIKIRPRLSPETKGLNRAVWLGVSGSPIESLLIQDPLLRSPSFEDIIPSAETPSNWTDSYGTHIIGYVHPPVSGDFQFWIAANDAAEFYLSTSDKPEDSTLVASTTAAVNPRNWDKYETQKSPVVSLQAGKKYFIEVLHKEGDRSDNLAIAWAGPGLNAREVITAGYLSPAYDSNAYAEHILVLAGDDQTIRWPLDSVDLYARVFDQKEGPEPLEYQWSASNAEVSFSTPTAITTQATFPGPGNYQLSLTASDGTHFATDSLQVSVAPAFADNIGSITREVWLDLDGYRLDDFIKDPRFPNSPDITDTIESFDLPRSWADNYGTRVRGFIIPPVTGDYQFYVSADDYARVSINTTNQSFNGLKQIINSEGYSEYNRWDYRADQASTPIRLTAGQAYPIEMLHRERTGGDHAVLAWKIPGSTEISIISGNFLSPAKDAPEASKNLLVIAPKDIHQRWPQNTADLHGRAIDQNYGPESLSIRWVQMSGPGTLTFSSSVSLDTNVHASMPGDYVIRLYASDGSEEIFDELDLTIDIALSSRTGAATRSKFTEISGSRVIDMIDSEKFPNAPDEQAPLSQLDTKLNSDGDSYGTLVTGFIHPPASGTYRFSVTGDDWAEVWLSTNESPDRKAMICFTPRATDQYEWDLYPEYQTSAEIELKEGEKYYIEIRHKEHNWRDHFAVAWLRPDQTEMTIIQGAYLSPFDDEAPILSPKISIAGLPTTTIHIGDTYVEQGYNAVDQKGTNITDQVVVTNHINTEQAGSYSVRYQVINPNTGFAETVVRTVNVVAAESHPAVYPDPSCRPPLMVDWVEPAPSQITANDASRFLAQATFGPTKSEIAHVQEIGYEAWIDEQLALEPSLHVPQILKLKPALDDLGYRIYSDERLTTWWTTAIKAPDQLRQRVAFALSEIVVLSDKSAFNNLGLATANYYDILVRNGLGSYEQILQEVTLNPLMGNYLTMLRSDKSSPDENFAREIMQLFSIGLIMLNPDGTELCDVNGHGIATYDNELIIELARAFTGWTFNGSRDFNYTEYGQTDYMSPMVPYDEHHDFGRKKLMGGYTLPQGLTPREDLQRAVKHVADHPNVGPFIGRRLIQRLTTSNPSPAYIYRVTKVYNNDGHGQRGNLGAVVKAILLDPEARNPESYGSKNFGKLREPILRLTQIIRSLEAETSSNPPVFGRYPIDNTTNAFAQSPLQAPSVFNFFEPDYAPPGPIMNAGLVAPEFATTTEITTVDTANFLHRVVNDGVPVWYRYSANIRPNLANLIAKAADTNTVIDELDSLLMAGSMSPETRSIIKTSIEAMDDPKVRVESALKLILTSPEYSIQK